MTETRSDWVAAYIDDAHPVGRDRAAHEALRKMHRALAPDLQDRVVVESYYAPEANGWRLVMHRIPYTPPAPSSPEEEEARRRAAIEEALADPRGLALARAIIERKDLHEALASFKPGGTSADDEPLFPSGRVEYTRAPESDRILNQEKVDAFNAARDAVARPRVTEIPSEAELRADLTRPKTGLTRGDGPAFA